MKITGRRKPSAGKAGNAQICALVPMNLCLSKIKIRLLFILLGECMMRASGQMFILTNNVMV